jgi:hypothetical protein
MEYYRNVDIDRDETIGESEREEADEFAEILGGVEIPQPVTHTVVAAIDDGDGDIDADANLEVEEEAVEAGVIDEE